MYPGRASLPGCMAYHTGRDVFPGWSAGGASFLRASAGLVWRWMSPGIECRGLWRRACLRGSYGVLRASGGCLASVHGIPRAGAVCDPGRVPSAMDGGKCPRAQTVKRAGAGVYVPRVRSGRGCGGYGRNRGGGEHPITTFALKVNIFLDNIPLDIYTEDTNQTGVTV